MPAHCSRVAPVIGSSQSLRRNSAQGKMDTASATRRYAGRGLERKRADTWMKVSNKEEGQGIINWLLCVAVIGERGKLRTAIHPFPGPRRLSPRLPHRSRFKPLPSLFFVAVNRLETWLRAVIFRLEDICRGIEDQSCPPPTIYRVSSSFNSLSHVFQGILIDGG